MKFALALALLASALAAEAADESAPRVGQIPLQRGLVMVSALRWDQGDRENIVRIEQLSANGVTYGWNTRVPDGQGRTQRLEFSRYVRSVDLAKATRLHSVYWTSDKADYPGYTGWSVSTAVYDSLLASGESPFVIVTNDRDPIGAQAVVSGLLRQTKRMKGTLRLATKEPETFALLFNGKRVQVPARRVGGKFGDEGSSENVELTVLADRAHPLLLKTVMGKDVWQIVRIETPQDTPARTIEQQLSQECRVELPGIYFGFAAASLDEQSDRTLAALAQVLAQHPDWSVSIEGHTDDIGADAANMKLSQARADAVRSSLAQSYSIAAGRLKAVGFGETRPRESNQTLEGRARNRRVELVRACAGRS